MSKFMTPDEHLAQYDWSNPNGAASEAAEYYTDEAKLLLEEQWDTWLAYNESAMLKCSGVGPEEGFGSLTEYKQLKMFYHWLGGFLKDEDEE